MPGEENGDKEEEAHIMANTEIPNTRQLAVFTMVMGAVENGKIPHGHLKKVADDFNISRKVIHRIVKSGLAGRTIEEFNMAEHMPTVISKRSNCGLSSKYDPAALPTVIKQIPMQGHRTLQDMCASLQLPLFTTH